MPAYKALSKTAFEHVKDIHSFENKSARPQGASAVNQGSAKLIWESSTVHRDGGIAGYQKSNRGTNLDQGD